MVGESDATPWLYIEEFGFLNLCDLVEDDIGSISASSLMINDSLQITGNVSTGEAFLLTPVANFWAVVPEPATGIMLMLGIAAMLFRRHVVVS